MAYLRVTLPGGLEALPLLGAEVTVLAGPIRFPFPGGAASVRGDRLPLLDNATRSEPRNSESTTAARLIGYGRTPGGYRDANGHR